MKRKFFPSVQSHEATNNTDVQVSSVRSIVPIVFESVVQRVVSTTQPMDEEDVVRGEVGSSQASTPQLTQCSATAADGAELAGNTESSTSTTTQRWSPKRIADSIAHSLSSVIYNAQTEGLSRCMQLYRFDDHQVEVEFEVSDERSFLFL